MGSWKKESVIKKLDGYVKPEVKRNDKGIILSVGMSDGQNYYTYNKLESGLDRKPRKFDGSKHKEWGGFNYYLKDIACLIENGQIYIEYVEHEPEKPVINNQLAMF
jgi:hypothetical protein